MCRICGSDEEPHCSFSLVDFMFLAVAELLRASGRLLRQFEESAHALLATLDSDTANST